MKMSSRFHRHILEFCAIQFYDGVKLSDPAWNSDQLWLELIDYQLQSRPLQDALVGSIIELR